MLLQLVLYVYVLLLLNVDVQITVAQTPATSSCPSVDVHVDDRFLDILRNIESEGDLCKINITGSKIGPYQISKAYYDDALDFNEDLERPGTVIYNLSSYCS